ncbi:hypothetical protein DIPPA_21576 [Diplonema papillatum]|nr:hypothetical protein DIPPA_21576 [Diplonema papillatum]
MAGSQSSRISSVGPLKVHRAACCGTGKAKTRDGDPPMEEEAHGATPVKAKAGIAEACAPARKGRVAKRLREDDDSNEWKRRKHDASRSKRWSP